MNRFGGPAILDLSGDNLTDGGLLSLDHAAALVGGRDHSPALSWNWIGSAQSYAVTCYDPDAPTGSGFWHWILADLPSTTTQLPSGVTGVGRSFTNDLGTLGYAGAAPPPGSCHRYQFRVHALDVETLPLSDRAPNALARFLIYSHTFAVDELTLTFPGSPE